MRVFYDREHDKIVLEEALIEEWEEMDDLEKAEHGYEFENYVENSQDYNNGILEELDEDQIEKYLAYEAKDYYEDLFGDARMAIMGGWY